MRSLDWYQRLAAIAGGFQDLRGIYSRIRTFPSLHASHPLAHEWWDQERKRALRTIRQTLQSLRYDLSPVEVSFFLVFDDNASGEETGILDVDIMSEELDEGEQFMGSRLSAPSLNPPLSVHPKGLKTILEQILEMRILRTMIRNLRLHSIPIIHPMHHLPKVCVLFYVNKLVESLSCSLP